MFAARPPLKISDEGNVTFGDHTVTATDIDLSPYDTAAYYEVSSDGNTYHFTKVNGSTSAAVAYSGEWLNVGSAADYEIYCSVVGELWDGTRNTWLPCDTIQLFSIARTTAGTQSATLSFQCRVAATLEVIDTWTITLNIDNSA